MQSFSKYAPPAVWYLATSYHKPLYFSIEKLAAGGGLEQADMARATNS